MRWTKKRLYMDPDGFIIEHIEPNGPPNLGPDILGDIGFKVVGFPEGMACAKPNLATAGSIR